MILTLDGHVREKSQLRCIEIDRERENAAPDRVFAKDEIAAEKAIQELDHAIGKPWLVRFLAHRARTIAGVK